MSLLGRASVLLVVLVAHLAHAHDAKPIEATAAIRVELFELPPGHPDLGAVNRNPRALATRVEYPVQLGLRDLASAAVTDGGALLSISLPNGHRIELNQRSFNPEFGFKFNERDEVEVDPGVRDNELIYYWYGVGANVDAAIQVRSGAVSGRVRASADDLFVLSTVGSMAVLRDIDVRLLPRDTVASAPSRWSPKVFRLDASDEPLDYATPKTVGLDVIEVLPVYSQVALTQAGSLANLDTLVSQVFNDVNAALANSGVLGVHFVNASLSNKLACEEPVAAEDVPSCGPGPYATPPVARPITYDEVPTACTGPAPHPLCDDPANRYALHKRSARESDQIASLRNDHRADVVLLLISDPSKCGNAYIQQNNCGATVGETGCGTRTEFSPFAFVVLSTTTCMSGNYTGAHELGHTLGLEHEIFGSVASPPGQASFIWSYAHVKLLPLPRVSSLMADGGFCDPQCPRDLQFSNPSIGFVSQPAFPSGVLEPAPDGRVRFNARTLSLFAPYVAGFREESVHYPDRIFRSSMEPLPDVCDPILGSCPD